MYVSNVKAFMLECLLTLKIVLDVLTLEALAAPPSPIETKSKRDNLIEIHGAQLSRSSGRFVPVKNKIHSPVEADS